MSEDHTIPTIKGIFLNSHIAALRKEKGDEAVAELKKRMGKKLEYGNSTDVPVSEEVRLIEHALTILRNDQISESDKAFEAGKLHFKNFVTTPLARIIFPVFRNQFKLLMLNANNIAGHVFNHVGFESQELGEKSVKITMLNNDYPIDHFQGLFQAWMEYSDLTGTVTAEKMDHRYEYTIKWE
ncbi:MAG: DUF2378 family protein [Candidatus Roizmanbacteria bacterium]|nr:DUF2378 family protein [Candidatus Roizmanbacteria bacterium]